MVLHVGAGHATTRPEWFECCWPSCERLAEGGGPPLCDSHYRRVGMQFMEECHAELVSGFPLAPPERRSRDERQAAREDAQKAQSLVYYVRIGDHVKIGYTVNVRQRLANLRVDPDALLATEPGGRSLEAMRHKEFADERVGRRENFNPSRRLLAHIDNLRATWGEPRITTHVKV